MDEFTSKGALQYAAKGRTEEWVHKFLLSVGKNKELSDGLRKAPRIWEGPILMQLSRLERSCGPEQHMEFVMAQGIWDAKTDAIARAVEQGTDLPPLLAEYRAGHLSLRDGNHRHGGLLKAGKTEYWTIIWYNEARQ